MINIDLTDVRRMEADMRAFAHRAYPFATKATVNKLAFSAQSSARQNIQDDMTNRNRYTAQSVRVEQARGLNVRTQLAVVGSIAGYMETQEFGGIKRNPTLPTTYSAGEALNARLRTRLPRTANKMASITLRRRRRPSGGRGQRNLVAVKQAAESNRKFVYMDLGRRKGIFKVIGGKRRPKVRMVHDMTHTSVVIPRSPWLAPAVQQAQQRGQEFYRDALAFQLRRAGLFQ